MFVSLNAIFQVRDQYLRLLVLSKLMGGKRQQNASIGVQFITVAPQILKGFALKSGGIGFDGSATGRQRVEHPGLHVVIFLFLFLLLFLVFCCVAFVFFFLCHIGVA